MRSRVLWALLMLIRVPGVSSAQGEQWQVGTTPTFSTGKYGTDTRTEILYTPVLARRLFDAGDLTFVFPFLCIKGLGNVTVVNGSPVPTGPAGTAPSRSPADRSGAGTRGAAATAIASSAKETTVCGIGDLVVRGRYFLLDERGFIPTIAVRAHFKAPTASAGDGLGTGRPDEGIGVEVSRAVGRGFTAMVDGGYTFIGKPDGVDLRNSWWYDFGVGRDLAGGTVNVSVFFEEYSAISTTFANARDVLAALSVRSAGWRLQLSGEVGLSDGAPARGLTIGASRRF